MFLAQLAELFI